MITRSDAGFRIEGAVTMGNAGALLQEARTALQGDRVVVDLGGLGEVDSAAISLMLEWTRTFRAQGREIVFANLGSNLASLARLYGVTDLIPLAGPAR